jgi:GxxExxY protein
VTIPVTYKSTVTEHAFRRDILVADTLVVEVKAVETLLPVHTSQVLTDLRFGCYPVGLLFNFNAFRLMDAMTRVSL